MAVKGFVHETAPEAASGRPALPTGLRGPQPVPSPGREDFDSYHSRAGLPVTGDRRGESIASMRQGLSSTPIPPRHLIERVTPPTDASDEDVSNAFVSSGNRSVEELERALAAAGRRSPTDFEAILDWGCGPGRLVLPLLDRYPSVRLTGVDTDAGPIAWLRDKVPRGEFRVVDPLPPTSLADDSFDLVINHSVLTHLDDVAQRSWLAEIVRLLRPGGWFVTSVHGVDVLLDQLGHVDQVERDRWLGQWHAERFVFVADDGFIGSGHHDGYHTTFQDPATVEQLSGYALEPLIVAYRGDLGYQDQLVLRKRSAAEAGRRRSIEPVSSAGQLGHLSVLHEMADDDSRLARIERNLDMSVRALSRLGQQVARLENTVQGGGSLRSVRARLRRWAASIRRP